MALLDVRKEINFCRKVGLPIVGVVENMSGFVCPSCATETQIFQASTGGAKKMCEDMGVPFLGAIPLDPRLGRACDEGLAYFEVVPDSPAVTALNAIRDSPSLPLFACLFVCGRRRWEERGGRGGRGLLLAGFFVC